MSQHALACKYSTDCDRACKRTASDLVDTDDEFLFCLSSHLSKAYNNLSIKKERPLWVALVRKNLLPDSGRSFGLRFGRTTAVVAHLHVDAEIAQCLGGQNVHHGLSGIDTGS